MEKSIYSLALRHPGPHKSVPQDTLYRGNYVKTIYTCGQSVPSVSPLSFTSFIGHVKPPPLRLPFLSWSAPCVPHVGLWTLARRTSAPSAGEIRPVIRLCAVPADEPYGPWTVKSGPQGGEAGNHSRLSYHLDSSSVRSRPHYIIPSLTENTLKPEKQTELCKRKLAVWCDRSRQGANKVVSEHVESYKQMFGYSTTIAAVSKFQHRQFDVW